MSGNHKRFFNDTSSEEYLFDERQPGCTLQEEELVSKSFCNFDLQYTADMDRNYPFGFFSRNEKAYLCWVDVKNTKNPLPNLEKKYESGIPVSEHMGLNMQSPESSKENKASISPIISHEKYSKEQSWVVFLSSKKIPHETSLAEFHAYLCKYGDTRFCPLFRNEVCFDCHGKRIFQVFSFQTGELLASFQFQDPPETLNLKPHETYGEISKCVALNFFDEVNSCFKESKELQPVSSVIRQPSKYVISLPSKTKDNSSKQVVATIPNQEKRKYIKTKRVNQTKFIFKDKSETLAQMFRKNGYRIMKIKPKIDILLMVIIGCIIPG